MEYRKSVDQLSDSSMRIESTYLQYILVWADDTSFMEVMGKRPTLPGYLLKNRLDGGGKRLSVDYMKKILSTSRRFFNWIPNNNRMYRSLLPSWIETLKPRRATDPPKENEVANLEYVMEIANSKVKNLLEERIRASAVLWFLSGIRIGAFVSLPLEAVDIENKEIKQFPSLGVRTKNGKYAVTFLYEIPELLLVVNAWDKKVRKVLPNYGFWFAPLKPRTRKIDQLATSIGEHRANLARRNLKNWLEMVGIPYKAPHQFRHGHIQYGLKNSKNLEDFKAVSMNVMHGRMATTDEIYSKLKRDDIKARISVIRKGSTHNSDHNALASIERILEEHKLNK